MTKVERQRAWQQANRDKVRANSVAWRKRNPVKNAARAKTTANRERARETTRMRKYGLTRDELRALLEQDKLCAVCGQAFKSERNRHVDHNHVTRVVRGVTCSRCNTVLGLVRDELSTLAALGRYLVNRRRGFRAE